MPFVSEKVNKNEPTKESALKELKKQYNKHKISYKEYMLQTKRVEKYWDILHNVQVVNAKDIVGDMPEDAVIVKSPEAGEKETAMELTSGLATKE